MKKIKKTKPVLVCGLATGTSVSHDLEKLAPILGILIFFYMS